MIKTEAASPAASKEEEDEEDEVKIFIVWYHICLRDAAKKNRFFFGKSFPNLFTHPPTPGFLWDLGNQKVKFGSKKAIFGVIFLFRGFDLVWESATPPTHIWENFPN